MRGRGEICVTSSSGGRGTSVPSGSAPGSRSSEGALKEVDDVLAPGQAGIHQDVAALHRVVGQRGNGVPGHTEITQPLRDAHVRGQLPDRLHRGRRRLARRQARPPLPPPPPPPWAWVYPPVPSGLPSVY